MKNLYLSSALVTLLSVGHGFATENMDDPNNWDAKKSNNSSNYPEPRIVEGEPMKKNKGLVWTQEKDEKLKKVYNEIKELEEIANPSERQKLQLGVAKAKRDLLQQQRKEADNEAKEAEKKAKDAADQANTDDEIKRLREELAETKKQQTRELEQQAKKLQQVEKEKNEALAAKAKLEALRKEALDEDAAKRTRKAAKSKQEEEVAKLSAAQKNLVFEADKARALADNLTAKQPLNSSATTVGVLTQESVFRNLFVYFLQNNNYAGQIGRHYWAWFQGSGWGSLQGTNQRIENGIFKTDTSYDNVPVYFPEQRKTIKLGLLFSSKGKDTLEGNTGSNIFKKLF